MISGQSIASRQPAPLGGSRWERRSWRAGSSGFRTPAGADLRYLVKPLASGQIDPRVGWLGSWDRAAEAVRPLLTREFAGEAALDASPSGGLRLSRPRRTVILHVSSP